MNEVLVSIILLIITIMGALITKVLIPYLESKVQFETREHITFWIKAALYAAEKAYKEQGSGLYKKDYVLQFIKKKIPALSDEEIKALIEAFGVAFGIFKEEKSDGIEATSIGNSSNNI